MSGVRPGPFNDGLDVVQSFLNLPSEMESPVGTTCLEENRAERGGCVVSHCHHHHGHTATIFSDK